MKEISKRDLLEGYEDLFYAPEKSLDQYDQIQLKRGAEVEKEHTPHQQIAEIIAAHHLDEDEKYYDKLKKVEAAISKRTISASVFDMDNAALAVSDMKSKINAPVVNANLSTLGGSDKASIILSISLDPKEQWQNGIYQNSHYLQFSINTNGDMDLFNRHYSIKNKFRKTRVGSVGDAISKINAYIASVTGA